MSDVTLLPATDVGRFDRVALLADVHGNAWALDAALTAARAASVDAYCFLGCLTWGPRPLEVLAWAASTGEPTFFLRGNGERAVLELAAGTRAPEQPVDTWMVAAHGPDGVAELAAFPTALIVSVAGLGSVRLCHGSPRSDIELLTPGTPEDRIDAACAGVAEDVVVHGHTHLQYQRAVGGRTIVGCGSVGLPYTDEPGAALWTLLDSDGVHPQRTEYDVGAAVDAVRRSDYPPVDRFVATLQSPPTPAEIIVDAETKRFSD